MLRLPLCFAVLLPGAVAILRHVRELHQAQDATPYKLVLSNFHDMSYSGIVVIGGQTVSGIFDTGSSDFVAFSSQCMGCGGGGYTSSLSSSYKDGHKASELSYGSGTCMSSEGFDEVAIGPLVAHGQLIYEAYRCVMPSLRSSNFQAIIGIGPPDRAIIDAQYQVDQWTALVESNSTSAMVDIAARQLESEKASLEIARTKANLFSNAHMTRFSVCLGRAAGSDGFLILNDVARQDLPGGMRARVVDNLSWMLKVSHVGFGDGSAGSSAELGCRSGCGALLDSGTSLIAVDSGLYEAMFEYISSLNIDCSDLGRFPDLVLDFDGNVIRLPPEAYIGEVEASVANFAEDAQASMMHTDRASPFLHAGRVHENGQPVMCRLLILDLGMQSTSSGPMMILGMPLFREFYTTFEFGSGPDDRSITLTPTGADCEPGSAADLDLGVAHGLMHYGLRQEESEQRRPRLVKPSEIQLPRHFQVSA
mmetsp:Transcript_137516/g.293922  ORF Transcript_137516/g.293922 Transcript_137516/m.293922 type:complete len:478 (-) Transcript_137516:29-1462(-)